MLRSYQQEAALAVRSAWADRRSAFIALPTGTGKTRTFCQIGTERPGRVLVVAHRQELLDQCAGVLRDVHGEEPAYEMAGQRADMGWERKKWVLSTVQSLHRRKEKFGAACFETIIIDEAHHAPAHTYQALYHYFTGKILGVSATPEREGVEELFPSIDYRMSLYDAIVAGWLVDIEAIRIDAKVDLRQVKTTAGDLNQGQLASIMEAHEAVYIVANETLKHAGDRQTIVFAVSVAQAAQICDQMNYLRKDSSLFLSGQTPSQERRSAIEDYRAGRYQFLVNCQLATEGWDLPAVKCISVARPTKSKILHTQMIGRGLRPTITVTDDIDRRAAIEASGSGKCTILDFVGNCGRHKLVGTMDHFKAKERHKEIIETWLKTGRAVSVTRAADEAEKEVVTLPKVKPVIQSRQRYLDALGILESEPPPARFKKAHPAALQLVRAHYWLEPHELSKLSAHEAESMRRELVRRWRQGLCSVKQARVLRRYGYSTEVNRAEASKLLDQLSANGWRK